MRTQEMMSAVTRIVAKRFFIEAASVSALSEEFFFYAVTARQGRNQSPLTQTLSLKGEGLNPDSETEFVDR